MDELWRILQASELMVAIIDALQRLNRQRGLGQILCTHIMNDLAMPTEAAMIASWSDEATISHGNRAAAPPGRGKFLLKIGKGRGIPARAGRLADRWGGRVRATNRLPEPSGETGWFYALGAIAVVLGVIGCCGWPTGSPAAAHRCRR